MEKLVSLLTENSETPEPELSQDDADLISSAMATRKEPQPQTGESGETFHDFLVNVGAVPFEGSQYLLTREAYHKCYAEALKRKFGFRQNIGGSAKDVEESYTLIEPNEDPAKDSKVYYLVLDN